MGDAQILDSMLRDGLNDAFSGDHSGWHTEDLVSRYSITREEQDRWAARSQQRFSAAQAAGRFKDEIVRIEIPGRKGPVSFDKDEQNRPETTIETLAKLKPAFRKDGTITAGNAPGLNSGAAGIVVAEGGFAESHGLKPVARLVSHAVAAVEPGFFGLGPVPAVPLALKRASCIELLVTDSIPLYASNRYRAFVPPPYPRKPAQFMGTQAKLCSTHSTVIQSNFTGKSVAYCTDLHLCCTQGEMLNGGGGRNRTGVHGFAVRCMATLPPRPAVTYTAGRPLATNSEASFTLAGESDAVRAPAGAIALRRRGS
jgi:Thiolase, N-terminal domain